MKLVIFHPGFVHLGGAEMLAVAQAHYLREQGLSVEIVTLDYDAKAWKERMQGLPVKVVQRRNVSDILLGLGPVAKLRARARRTESYLKTGDVVLACNHPCSTMLGQLSLPIPRVWQCNEPPRGLYMAQANPFQAARAVTAGPNVPERATQEFRRHLHVAKPRREKRYNLLRAQDLTAVEGLDLVYAISAFSRDNARAIYGRCEETPIYPIVNFPDQIQSKSGLSRSGLKVLVHSRLTVAKNIDTVLRGFARFYRKHPGATLHIVGEGTEENFLMALAEELLPATAVHFHGFLPEQELHAVYAACDVFALLTLDEPFGLVYPEAAARGLLLVGSDHGGPMEILDGGALGEVCDAFSPEALEAALERILAMDDLAVDALRLRADTACRQRYAKEVVGRAQLDLLIRLTR